MLVSRCRRLHPHAQHRLGDIATIPTGSTPRAPRPTTAKRCPSPNHTVSGRSSPTASLGKLYRRTGNRDEAPEHLTTATTMYREMDMRFWLEQAEDEMRELRA
jgi:hypothetical protein